MKQFLAEYWLYIVVPIAIVVLCVIVLAVTSDDPAGPFHYNF
jgi:hypothetical protein